MFFVYKMGFSASASETSKATSEHITVSNHGQRSRATLKTRRIHVPVVKHQTHATTLNTPTSRLITQSWPFTAAAFQQRTELSTIRKLWTKLRCSSPATTCNESTVTHTSSARHPWLLHSRKMVAASCPGHRQICPLQQRQLK